MTITALPPAPSRATDDPSTFSAKADAFLAALTLFVDEANALEAATAATNLNGTSVTSLTIGTGSKTLTSQTGKAWQIGTWVILASTAGPTNYMYGQVTAYTSGTGSLTINVSAVGGSGTFTSWVVALSTPPASTPLSGTITGTAGTTLLAGTDSNVTQLISRTSGSGTSAVAQSGTTSAHDTVVLTNNVERMRTGANGDTKFSGSAATTPNATISSGTAFTLPCRNSNVFVLTMTGNVLAAGWTISNPSDGQTINLFITQDATGGRTLGWPTSFKWAGGAAPTISSAALAVDLLVATYRAATGFWYCSLAKGFA